MNPLEQLSIFSDADKFLKAGMEAIRTLEFEKAKLAFKDALAIDPLLTNLQTWQNILDLMIEKKSGNSVSGFIALMWKEIQERVIAGIWLDKEGELADYELSGIARQHIKQHGAFVDDHEQLHWGVIYYVCRDYQTSQRLLLNSLTHDCSDRAGLWAFYANVLSKLKRRNESRSAFLQALVLNPFIIDYTRLYIREIHVVYHQILTQHPEKEAQALFIFLGWLKGLWHIPRSDSESFISNLRKTIQNVNHRDKTGSLRRFTLYLYLDQSSKSGEINLDAREKMQALEPDLFNQYLRKVEEIQQKLL